MFDIEIKKGVKPAKFLNKQLKNENLAREIAESLKYKIKIVDNLKDCRRVLEDCRSCQSDNENQYFNVWNSIKDISIIGLFDGEKYVARCIINETAKKFLPIYGEKHFLLKARLEFFGFKPGEVTSIEKIKEVLKIVENLTNEKTTRIKKTIEVNREPLTADELNLLNEFRNRANNGYKVLYMDYWKVPAYLTYKSYCKDSDDKEFDYNEIQRISKKLKRYNQAIKKHNDCSFSYTEYKTLYNKFVEYKTKFYFDTVKEFICVSGYKEKTN
jgi:hypothetical protein